MRKILGLIAAVGMLVAATTGTALAHSTLTDSDVHGPQCMDISDGRGAYDTSTVAVAVNTSKPSCAFGTYRLVVYSDETATQQLAAESQRGNGFVDPIRGPELRFILDNVTDPQNDGTVCVTATTTVGRHVFDRGPDDGCLEINAGGVSGGRKMR
jgi:hypothetical protein